MSVSQANSPADVVFDLLRSGAGILGAHGDRRVAQLGHQRDRQALEGQPAEHDRREEHHQDGDGT
jgi:hypothetical protein